MAQKRKKQRGVRGEGQTKRTVEHPLRIIGGRFRGRILSYHGDESTRPMKDRTREAVFNLIGPEIKGKHAYDLFAGTGALGLEAISRGAERATFIERFVPMARVIAQNIANLAVTDRTEVFTADTFFWSETEVKRDDLAWTVFCSPPYDLYVDEPVKMLGLIAMLIKAAPLGSQFVVEADKRFDMQSLPRAEEWDVREYAPAIVGVLVV